jgi:hypothetical protein
MIVRRVVDSKSVVAIDTDTMGSFVNEVQQYEYELR